MGDPRGGGDGRPRVSIIIPHLNTPDLLVRALQSVASQHLDHGWFEIIVVDNGSRLPLGPIATAWPDVRFLVERTPGPGPARNHGIAAARADRLAFVDADVRVCPGWLQAGVDALDADPSGPIGGDVRIDIGGKRRLSGVEAFECVFSFRQRRYIERERYSVTANLMMTRAVFDAVGPFGGLDTAEDADFGRRAHALGHRTRYVPAMRALHPPRASMEEMRRKWRRLSSHAHVAHSRAGGSPMAWRMKAVAVALSGPAHAPRMLVSRRIRGLGNRLRGLGFLLGIRWARALDMLSLAREAAAVGEPLAMNWNR
jgi:glycosyltransferase involved in cell wall biosynthesis